MVVLRQLSQKGMVFHAIEAYPYTLEHFVYNFAGIYQNVRKRFCYAKCYNRPKDGSPVAIADLPP